MSCGLFNPSVKHQSLEDDMIDQTQMRYFGNNPEPCLAGTLALMSSYRRCRCPQAAKKIVHNLFVLAQQKYFSAEFRLVLEQLHADWLPDAEGATARAQNLADRGSTPSQLH